MQAAAKFQLLIEILDAEHKSGQTTVLRSKVSLQLISRNTAVYREAGVGKFKEYIALAQRHGIVELGGVGGYAWMSLHPSWHDRR
jgi:hypothetical protein